MRQPPVTDSRRTMNVTRAMAEYAAAAGTPRGHVAFIWFDNRRDGWRWDHAGAATLGQRTGGPPSERLHGVIGEAVASVPTSAATAAAAAAPLAPPYLATLVLWTYAEANPDLLMDQGACDTAEDILSQCYAAWRTPEAARAVCEAEIRDAYVDGEDFVLPAEFLWREEDAGHGLVQWRLDFPDAEGVRYIVHPVRVLD